MRDQMKVILGLGSIWGLFALGATVLSLFTLGKNDTAPEISAIVLYGFTILPACLLAIRYQTVAGYWLVALCPLAAFGFLYQVVAQSINKSRSLSLGQVLSMLLMAAIPGLLGFYILHSRFRGSSGPFPAKLDE